MRYFGGKFRVRKQLSQLINSYKPKVYLEPFCGSAWVAELVTADVRICTDLNKAMISLWTSVQRGWEPPDEITQEQYYAAKLLPASDPLHAFCGFGCSFAGKFYGGYARDGHGADAKTAKSQLQKRVYAKTAKSQGLKGVDFSALDYESSLDMFADFSDVIYCDPPYANTTKFYGLPDFDTNRFWEVIRSYSKHRLILVSEYSAPTDFETVLEIPTRTDIRSSTGKLIPRIGKVYKLK